MRVFHNLGYMWKLYIVYNKHVMRMYLMITVEQATLPHANEACAYSVNDLDWYVLINSDISLPGLSHFTLLSLQ